MKYKKNLFISLADEYYLIRVYSYFLGIVIHSFQQYVYSSKQTTTIMIGVIPDRGI